MMSNKNKKMKGYSSFVVTSQQVGNVHKFYRTIYNGLKCKAINLVEVKGIVGDRNLISELDIVLIVQKMSFIPIKYDAPIGKRIPLKIEGTGNYFLSASVPHSALDFIIITILPIGITINLEIEFAEGTSNDHAKFHNFIYKPTMDISATFDYVTESYDPKEIDRMIAAQYK